MGADWRCLVLWLFVIDLGIACGAGLYEGRVVIPAWKEIPPRQWPNTGLLFWIYVTTIPLTLLAVINGIAAWSSEGARRPYWLCAAAVIALERVGTFAYFIPAMVGLAGSDLPPPEVEPALSRWLLLNHGRHVLTLSGWLLAIRTLSLSHRE